LLVAEVLLRIEQGALCGVASSSFYFSVALLNKSNFAELKDQITHPPDNTDHSVAKQKFRITNWSTYNKAHQPWLPHFLAG
jgi:hypothetical protein